VVGGVDWEDWLVVFGDVFGYDVGYVAFVGYVYFV